MKTNTPRTKVTLTIAGLLALTGIFYAASPTRFGSVPEPIGVAAAPSQLIVSEYCSQNLDKIDCLGNVSVLATIPGPIGPCLERYITIAPSQSALAGFTPATSSSHKAPRCIRCWGRAGRCLRRSQAAKKTTPGLRSTMRARLVTT